MNKTLTQEINDDNKCVIVCKSNNMFRTEHWGMTDWILNARVFSKQEALLCVVKDDDHIIYPISSVTLKLNSPIHG